MKCSLKRRVGIIIYDSLLLFSVYFFATLIAIPFNSGQAIIHGNLIYDLYLLLLAYLYFTWQWLHGGQTLAMKAWKVRLVPTSNNRLNWKTVSIRFLLSILSWIFLGAGFIWCLFDREQLAFHDRFSNSQLIYDS